MREREEEFMCVRQNRQGAEMRLAGQRGGFVRRRQAAVFMVGARSMWAGWWGHLLQQIGWTPHIVEDSEFGHLNGTMIR